MRSWLLVLVVVSLPAVSLSAGFSALNPAVRNPVGTGRVPVSSYSNGLVATPVPIDATADLSMTGNLRHGKYFQGNVPYRSTSDVGLDPGTSSLNSHWGAPSLSSFLRDTAGPEDFSGLSSVGYGARPYYSASEAAARTVPGDAGVFSPQGTGNSLGFRRQEPSAPTDFFALESASRQHVLSEQGTAATAAGSQLLQTRHHPLSESLSPSDGTFIRSIALGLQDVERLTTGEAAVIRRQDDNLTLEQLRERSLQSSFDLGQDSAIEDRGFQLGRDEYRPEARGANTSTASLGDVVGGRNRLSPAQRFGQSPAIASGQESIRPDSRRFETTSAALTPGKHDGLASRETDGVRAVEGHSPNSQTAAGPGATSRKEHDDALGRIRQQLDALSKSVESRLQAGPGSVSAPGVVAPSKETHVTSPKARPPVPSLGEAGGVGLDDSTSLLRAYGSHTGQEILSSAASESTFGPADATGEKRFEYSAIASREAAQKIRSLPDGIAGLSRTEISAEAKRVVGPHGSHEALATEKFSYHLCAADDHLRAGRYYKAANSFALASVYKPDDPQALVGRSHALFAAGEYISSSLFLSRALAVRPEQAKAGVDFVTLLGGPNPLAGRIADIEQWFARSGSGQLQLLLGYVYYQTGRLNAARRAVDAAHVKMPTSSAVAAVAAAINDAATAN